MTSFYPSNNNASSFVTVYVGKFSSQMSANKHKLIFIIASRTRERAHLLDSLANQGCLEKPLREHVLCFLPELTDVNEEYERRKKS